MNKQITKNKMKKWFDSLSISLPIVFILIFFGYFPIHYDIVLQTDNIVGEGICQTYVCPSATYAVFYNLPFYFGSELKKATLKGFHYDVNSIELINSDVSEFDIISIDSYIKGIHLSHIDPEDILPKGEEVTGTKVKLVSRDGALHVDVFDPNEGSTITISYPFIPSWFWTIYFATILLIAFLFSFLLLYIFNHVSILKVPVMGMTCIGVTLLAGCFFCGSMPYVTYINFLLNWLFLFSLSLLVNSFTFPFLGTVLVMAFTTIWYIANYFVIILRNKPIMPADLKAIGTAAEVMGGYTFAPSWQMVVGIAVVILYAVLYIITWKKNKTEEKQELRKSIFKRCTSALLAILLIFFGINTKTFKSLDSFAWDVVLLKSFHEEGMVLTYLKSAFNSDVKKPDGYSQDLIDSYLNEYKNKEAEKNEGIQPTNIIMVMNEAFSDLRGVGLNKQIDVMPYIDSLSENTIEGNCYVSVFGGGTCNTEFEALTGNSLAFFGSGAYPYTENITSSMFSLASYFKNLGYSTYSFHPNDPNNWNRNTVYPLLGFDTFYSISDFEEFDEVEKLHDLPADISDYRFIENVDKKNNNKPRFLFDVTMQNHSGYERWLDVEKAESVEEYGNNLYVDTQVYLSLIKASDDEIKQLIETYKISDEPTMIVFFGDHQPGLPETAINEIYGGVESYLDFYKSKFFIWTNYETEEQHDVKISANYLPWLILERGNFALPPYIQMLKELHEKYPIISSQGVMDNKGNIYTGVAEIADDPLIKKYKCIQYSNVIDGIDADWFKTD